MPDALAQMGGAFRDPGMPETLPNPTVLPPGMLVPGTINLQGRPLHINPAANVGDTGVSSELSTSMADERGREVLLPTVVNGRFLTPTGEMPRLGSEEEKEMKRRAWQRYEDTGEHMGIFINPEMADAYARQVHSRPMSLRSPAYLYRPPSQGYLEALWSRLGKWGQ